jgi:hypothetical protein
MCIPCPLSGCLVGLVRLFLLCFLSVGILYRGGWLLGLRAEKLSNGPCYCPLALRCRCCSLILVEKKAVDTCFHIHTVAVSTWSHVGRVEEIAYPTTEQALKNVATPKSSRPQLQSCGNFRIATPTQKEKTIAPLTINRKYVCSACEKRHNQPATQHRRVTKKQPSKPCRKRNDLQVRCRSGVCGAETPLLPLRGR